MSAFAQDFKPACVACIILGGAVIRPFMQCLAGTAEVAVSLRISMPKSIGSTHEVSLLSYIFIIQFPLGRYDIDDNVTKLDTKVCCLHHILLTPSISAHYLWTKTLVFVFVHYEKDVKGTFVENIPVETSIRDSLQHGSVDHPDAFLEDLTQNAESLIDL